MEYLCINYGIYLEKNLGLFDPFFFPNMLISCSKCTALPFAEETWQVYKMYHVYPLEKYDNALL